MVYYSEVFRGGKMIILLLAIISATTAFQGSTINLTVYEQSHVILDKCMYFEDTLTNEANLSRGTYQIYITYSCQGLKKIVVETNKTRKVFEVFVIKRVNKEELERLDSEILKLKRELKTANDKLKDLEDLVKTLNSLNAEFYNRIKNYRENIKELNDKIKSLNEEIEKLRTENKMLKNTSKNLNKTIEDLELKLTSLRNENSNLTNQIDKLRIEISTLQFYLTLLKNAFLFVVSFLIGSYFSILRK